jgi:hypothetical protein
MNRSATKKAKQFAAVDPVDAAQAVIEKRIAKVATLIQWHSAEQWCDHMYPETVAMILRVEKDELDSIDGLEFCKLRYKLETLDGEEIISSIAYDGAAVLEWWLETQAGKR